MTDNELDEMLWDDAWTLTLTRAQAVCVLWSIFDFPYSVQSLQDDHGVSPERLLASVQRLSMMVTPENMNQVAYEITPAEERG